MSDKILGAAEEYRLNIDTLLKEMNQGNGFGDDGKTWKPVKLPEPEQC